MLKDYKLKNCCRPGINWQCKCRLRTSVSKQQIRTDLRETSFGNEITCVKVFLTISRDERRVGTVTCCYRTFQSRTQSLFFHFYSLTQRPLNRETSPVTILYKLNYGNLINVSQIHDTLQAGLVCPLTFYKILYICTNYHLKIYIGPFQDRFKVPPSTLLYKRNH